MAGFDAGAFRRSGVSSDSDAAVYNVVIARILGNPDLGELVRYMVQDRRVVEIGCGSNGGLYLEMIARGAAGYVGVDPFHCPDSEQKEQLLAGGNVYNIPADFLTERVDFVTADGVSYLKPVQPGDGIVTVSTGTLESGIMPDPAYGDELVGQIARLVEEGRPSAFHGVDAHYKNLLEGSGLSVPDFRYITTSDGRRGYLVTLCR